MTEDKLSRAVARAIMLHVQFHNFGHYDADADWHCTGAQIAELEYVCAAAASAVIAIVQEELDDLRTRIDGLEAELDDD